MSGRSGVHVLGPDLDWVERLGTDSIRGFLWFGPLGMRPPMMKPLRRTLSTQSLLPATSTALRMREDQTEQG